jgi:hypothetical protein
MRIPRCSLASPSEPFLLSSELVRSAGDLPDESGEFARERGDHLLLAFPCPKSF